MSDAKVVIIEPKTRLGEAYIFPDMSALLYAIPDTDKILIIHKDFSGMTDDQINDYLTTHLTL